MWSHYADEHRGLCLIFNKEKLTGDGSLENPVVPMEYIEHGKIEYKNRNKIKVIFNNDKNLTLSLFNDKDVIFNKLNCWIYENEYRIFSKEDSKMKFDGFPFPFNKDALCGVIFGERSSYGDIHLIHSILSTYRYIYPGFMWGAGRIIPSTGNLISMQKYGEISVDEFNLERDGWLLEPFD